MRIAALGALFVLTGCASLDGDLQAAQAGCPQTSAMTLYVSCLNQVEAPVWRKDSPQGLPGFQDYASARLALAQNLDSGKITAAQFQEGAAQARARFSAALARNRPQQMQNTEEEIEALGKMSPVNPIGDKDGMMNNMGM